MSYTPINPISFRQGIAYALNSDQRLNDWFSNLATGTYKITGIADQRYNCIAWAAGKTNAHWWPGNPGPSYWPDGIPADTTLVAFIQLFSYLGYEPCDAANFERRFEKIAIYLKNGSVTHAARMLGNGRWSSKLGIWERIEHDFDGLTGHAPNEYGDIEQIMKRKKSLNRIVFEAIYYYAAERLG